MERNIKREAIVLKKILVGESNVGLTLLTSSDETFFVMAFGATKPKNKLFEGIGVFVNGVWDIYFDPVKDMYRAKDVSVINFNSEIGKSLEAYYLTSFFSEIILKSQGADGVYNLLMESIKCLYLAKHKQLLVQFLLRFLLGQGVLPDLGSGFDIGTLVYVEKTLGLDLEKGTKIGLDVRSLGKLQDYLIILLKEHIGGKLVTLETLNGII